MNFTRIGSIVFSNRVDRTKVLTLPVRLHWTKNNLDEKKATAILHRENFILLELE
jgi:hypothetical protein